MQTHLNSEYKGQNNMLHPRYVASIKARTSQPCIALRRNRWMRQRVWIWLTIDDDDDEMMISHSMIPSVFFFRRYVTRRVIQSNELILVEKNITDAWRGTMERSGNTMLIDLSTRHSFLVLFDPQSPTLTLNEKSPPWTRITIIQ